MDFIAVNIRLTSLLGYDAVQSGTETPTFRTKPAALMSSSLQMVVEGSSETSVYTHHTTRRHITEAYNLHGNYVLKCSSLTQLNIAISWH
jgi:hypothetical protein